MTTRALASFAAAALLLSTASATAHAEDPPLEPLPPATAAPPPASAPAKPTAVAPAAPPGSPSKSVPIGIRADGGYARRAIEKLPVVGADLGLALGAQPAKHIAVWGSTRLFLGSTENGLAAWRWRVGSDLDVVFDRLRLSIEPGLFIVGVRRATKNETIVSWGPMIGAAARFDFLQVDGFAIFARAAIEAGPVVSDGSLFWGPTFGGGIDFDLKKGDRSRL